MSKDATPPSSNDKTNFASGMKVSINFQDKSGRSSLPGKQTNTRKRPLFESDDGGQNHHQHNDRLLDSYDVDEIKKEQERSPPRMVIQTPPSRDWKSQRKQMRATRDTSKGPAQFKNNDKEEEEAVRKLTEAPSENGGSLTIDMQERDALQQDVASLPEMADLSAYESVPVEEFGKAMLRGMGWKDEDSNSKKTKSSVNKRPALLGLGAKPNPLTAEELGTWGAGSSKNQAKIEKTYVPLVKVSKTTGEIIKDKSPTPRSHNTREQKSSSMRSNGDDEDNRDYKRRRKPETRHDSSDRRDYDYKRDQSTRRHDRYDHPREQTSRHSSRR